MTKREEMDKLDKWERQEIVRRVTEERIDVLQAINQVKTERHVLYRKIIFGEGNNSPVSSTEEPLPSKEVL